MTLPTDAFQTALQAAACRALPGTRHIEHLKRLSAGATLETWSFDAVGPTQRWPLILRRSPGGIRAVRTLPLADEASLVRALRAAGAPVAEVVHILSDDDGLGDGFMMIRIDGETIPRKILRDAAFDAVRPKLVGQLATIAATLHAVDVRTLPAALPVSGVRRTLDDLRHRTEALDAPRPVFDLAIRWLTEHAPDEPAQARLVHGDYRHGNVIVGQQGIRAVLDWEIAHLGDPIEDLAWLCLPPWRFGNLDLPAGGLGTQEALLTAYAEATGVRVDPMRFRFWALLGSLRWGVSCASMLEWFRSGRNRTVERAMIVRRASENEMDIMRLLSRSA